MDDNKDSTNVPSLLESEKAGKVGCAIVIGLLSSLALFCQLRRGSKKEFQLK